MEVTIVYGFNVLESLKDFKEKVKKEIEKSTAMTVTQVDVVAKSVFLPKEEK